MDACVTPHCPMRKARLSDATATPAEPLPSNAESSGRPDRVVGREPYSRSDLVFDRSICPANSRSRQPQPSQKTRCGRTIAMDFAKGSQGAESCYKGGAATMGVLWGLSWLRRTSSHPGVDSLMSCRENRLAPHCARPGGIGAYEAKLSHDVVTRGGAAR